MTLFDHETGADIINPYICIYNPKLTHSFALNTSTFGLTAQDFLISIYDWKTRHELRDKENLYFVEAQVGQQKNTEPISEDIFFQVLPGVANRGVDAGGCSIKIPLGFLRESIVKKAFPRCFESFNELEKIVETTA